MALVSMEIHISHSSPTSNAAAAAAAANSALTCLAHGLQVPITWVTTNSSSSSSSLLYGMLTIRHPLTNEAKSISSVGYIGCLRTMCQQAAPASVSALLWNKEDAAVEAWMESAVSTILPLWTTTTSDDVHHRTKVMTRAISDYAMTIHRYLRRYHQTYLVGNDMMTAADVCIALWLVHAMVELDIPTVPCRCHGWMMTVLHQQGVASFVPDPAKWPRAMMEEEEEEEGMEQEAVVEQADAGEKEITTATTVTATTTTTTSEEPTMTTVTSNTTTANELPTTTTTTTTATAVATTTAVVTTTTTTEHSSDNPILALLQELQLDHEVYHHVPCVTAEELVQKVPIPPNETHTKNLLLRDKKHGLVLIVVAPSTPVHTKDIGTFMKLPAGTKTNFRLADEATLYQVLQCAPGCVGPLCIVYDNKEQRQISHLIVDAQLLDSTKFVKIHSHPMRNDTSVKVTAKVLLDYWKRNHVIEPTIIDFTSLASASAAPATAATTTTTAKALKSTKTPKTESSTVAVVNKDKKVVKKGETLLALQWKKEENFAMWYSDVIVLSEMIAYYDISGCYILRPWSYKIWELIQEWFNQEIRALGVENAYFPLFVSQERLEREKDHVEGFAPEVAWVTKSGDGELAKPIAIRPTSETIMYPAFSDWIRSHRDLPLLLNQWSNVVRWEFKDPTPFLRSREFLWQEGHTAHSTFDEANTMVRAALELYRRVYEELLAVPVIPGYKTEKEKFAGGHTTTTVEAYIAGSGRAIQGATSHHLGQNFGKMFDIKFQNEHGQNETAWQTSWGLTTRTIGVMIMVHGDDTGLVLPPRISPLQVVIVPIISKKLTTEDAKPYCQGILEQLQQANLRVKYDDREMYNPGWKYNHWEQKGVPLRIEVGPRDIEQQQVRVVVRYSGEKFDLSVTGLAEALKSKLDEIQEAMLAKAKAIRDSNVVQVTEWKDFVPNLELNHLVLTPWCGGEHKDWEEWVKTKSREESLNARGEGEEDARTSTSVAAKTLCIPFAQPDLPEGTKCIASGLPATCWILWGRSY